MKKNFLGKAICCVIAFCLGFGCMYFIVKKNPDLYTKTITELKKDVTVTDNGIADAVEKVYDAVVVVSNYKNNKLYASGTGFVFKKDTDKAYILTNTHVIDGSQKINVTFTNGETVETELVGSNVFADIAVLSIDSSKVIEVAELGSYNSMRVGDTVFAVGAPLDSVYSWSVTRGILSGKDRMVEVRLESISGEYVMKVMQTDAAINNGNSGGPLCNSNGEVIGVNSLKMIDTSVEGMGFAIPIEVAMDYANKIMNHEKFTQPYIGISMLNVTDAYYYFQYSEIINKYDITSGVIINEVVKGSPAEKAGLKASDVITKVGDNAVPSIGYLRYYLYSYKVGDKVSITFLRDGKEETTTITLGSSETIY